MTETDIRKEFEQFNLTEGEVYKILKFYKSGAELCAEVVGVGTLNDTSMKLTLNSLKYAVIQLLELRDGTR